MSRLGGLLRFVRRLEPRSLRSQLLSRSLAVLAVLLVLIGVLQYWFLKDFAYRNKAEALQSQADAFPRELFLSDSEPQRRHMDDKDGDNDKSDYRGRKPVLVSPELAVALIDTNGVPAALPFDINTKEAPTLSKEEYREALKDAQALRTGSGGAGGTDEASSSGTKTKTRYRIVADQHGEEQLVVFRTIGSPYQPTGLLQLSSPTKELRSGLLQQLMLFMGLAFFAMLAGWLLSSPILKRTLVPLSKIGSAVQRIDAGNLSERLPVHQGQVEIDRLSDSFNGMLERLESSFRAEREAKETMRRFAADASHELRTPLTSIHGFLEILLRGAAEKPEQLYSALNSMYGESRRINKLVEDLLLLAKLDRAPELQFREASLNDILREMEPQLRMLAGERRVTFLTEETPPLSVDPDKMKQVILNLFHNAVQHTPADTGEVTLLLSKGAGELRLGVKDNGTGIGPEHVGHVFDRFYRSESSRNRRSGGAGLGLSITKSIVEAHGGSIEVQSRLGEGTLFLIHLPLSK